MLMLAQSWHGWTAAGLEQMIHGKKQTKSKTDEACRPVTTLLKRSLSEGDKDQSQIMPVLIRKMVTKISNLSKFTPVSITPETLSRYIDYTDLKSKQNKDWLKTTIFESLADYVIRCYPVFDKSFEFLRQDSRAEVSLRPEEALKFEWKRIETFQNFPSNANISTLTLAKCGFYYSGSDDSVTCFSCGCSHSGWGRSDDPVEIHRSISPMCSFLNDTQSQNVAITHETDEPSTVRRSLQHEAENNSSGASFQNSLPSQAERTSGYLSNGNQNYAASSLSSTTSDQDHRYNNGVQASEGQQSPSIDEQQTSTAQLQNETRINDEQNGMLQRGQEVNAGPDLLSIQQNQNDHLQRINRDINNFDPLGINFDRPRYPAYAVLSVRISTYQDWPGHLTQLPRDMAMAGFLYAGYEDYAKCFFCGGGLRNWDPEDDPWVEHARWFPRCAFLRQNKGNEFVAHVQVQNSETPADDVVPTRNPNAEASVLQMVNATSRDNSFLSHSAVRSVLDMGYPLEHVTAAFQRVQIRKGREQIHATDILDIILDDEEKESNQGTVENENREENEREREPRGRSESVNSLSEILEATKLEDTASLMEENRQLKEQRRCKICLDKDAAIVLLPCGHLCCCSECAPAMRKCPLCRTFVKGTVKAWLT